MQSEIKSPEYMFVYALIWSIGGVMTEKDGIDFRKEFSTELKQKYKTSVPGKFPNKFTVFDYFVD